MCFGGPPPGLTLCEAPLCWATRFVFLQHWVAESSATRTCPSRAHMASVESPLLGRNLAWKRASGLQPRAAPLPAPPCHQLRSIGNGCKAPAPSWQGQGAGIHGVDTLEGWEEGSSAGPGGIQPPERGDLRVLITSTFLLPHHPAGILGVWSRLLPTTVDLEWETSLPRGWGWNWTQGAGTG